LGRSFAGGGGLQSAFDLLRNHDSLALISGSKSGDAARPLPWAPPDAVDDEIDRPDEALAESALRDAIRGVSEKFKVPFADALLPAASSRSADVLLYVLKLFLPRRTFKGKKGATRANSFACDAHLATVKLVDDPAFVQLALSLFDRAKLASASVTDDQIASAVSFSARLVLSECWSAWAEALRARAPGARRICGGAAP
jgi:hypothetical protein